ncbi:hypothetical protein CDCA_CDCA08G2480 [Cyanidium caldarium]|uniref:Uncharacterized protein n=1 Tax=Cyanidium caldarium TaxID=2771 RepID=A0AAV9IWF9_CYACA|nr:hypothetical protein CDCA_CDCA08G2480 [Cyanidium caldarium]
MAFVTGIVSVRGAPVRSTRLAGAPAGRVQRGVHATVRMQFKRLRWNEFEDRTAYAKLPVCWAGEVPTIGALDKPVEDAEKLPESVWGQKYEKPVQLTVTPEEEEAFKSIQEYIKGQHAEELRKQAERARDPRQGNGMMSNFREEFVDSYPCLEYWNRS